MAGNQQLTSSVSCSGRIVTSLLSIKEGEVEGVGRVEKNGAGND